VKTDVVVVGLNPTFELTFLVPRIEPGLQTASVYRKILAGKGNTVARLLVALGAKVRLVTILPREYANQLLDSRRCELAIIDTRIDVRFSVVLGEEAGPKRVIVRHAGPPLPNAPEVRELLLEEVAASLSEAGTLVVAGSLPLGMPSGVITEMVQLARGVNATSVLDVSDRALHEALQARPSVLKMNHWEFGNLLGVDGRDELLSIARDLQGRTGTAVVVSHGADGVYGADAVGGFKVAIIDPVTTSLTAGSGDAMTAGLVWWYLRTGAFRESVRYGAGLGTVAASSIGSGEIPTSFPDPLTLVGDAVPA